MPIEDLTEDGLAKNPNLELAQWKFLLTLPECTENKELKAKLLKAVQEVSCNLIKIFVGSLTFGGFSIKRTTWLHGMKNYAPK